MQTTDTATESAAHAADRTSEERIAALEHRIASLEAALVPLEEFRECSIHRDPNLMQFLRAWPAFKARKSEEARQRAEYFSRTRP